MSLAGVVSPHEYGIDSLHVRVVPVPVAATVFDSEKTRGAPVVAPSITETASEHVIAVRLVVLRVIVRVTVIVPPNVISAAASGTLSSVAAVTGRNAPVCGSQYPRTPELSGLFAA